LRFIALYYQVECGNLYLISRAEYDYERKREKVTITRKNAGIEVSDIVGGYLVSKLYIGYTIKEAKSLFNAEYRKEGK
jgi:hypothetical protein